MSFNCVSFENDKLNVYDHVYSISILYKNILHVHVYNFNITNITVIKDSDHIRNTFYIKRVHST